MSKDKNESKEYQLKAVDTNLIIYIRGYVDAILSGLISTIAMDKLGYPVTDKTKFNLSDDYGTLTITEVEDDEPNESPVKAAKENEVQGKANA